MSNEKSVANHNSIKVSKASIVFYVASVVFLMIAVFYFYLTYSSVSSYTQSEALELKDILNAYFSNCAPFFAYAIGCYGIGFIVAKLANLSSILSLCLSDAVEDESVSEAVEEIVFSEGNQTVVETTEHSEAQELDSVETDK